MEFEDDFDSPEFSPLSSPEHSNDSLKNVKRKSLKINVNSLISGKRKTSFEDQRNPENEYCEFFNDNTEFYGSDENNDLNCDANDVNDNDNTGLEDEGNSDTIEDIRRRNILSMNALLETMRKPELEKQFLKPKTTFQNKPLNTKPKEKKRRNRDTTFRFQGLIPVEIRKSSRLQHKTPQYKDTDLDKVDETIHYTYFKRPNYSPDDYYTFEDLEDVVYKPRRHSTKRKIEERIIIPVEDVTQAMLNKIAVRVKTKVYSQDGTTCHQCRQKTLDQKTCCRNPDCTGIQGMFCGVCIKNRYGEEAAEALKDPNWNCPVCRGICNCSICRAKQGKRPTGILAPICQQQGYESVSHFLKNLKGFGDRPEQDGWLGQFDDEALLGFSPDGKIMNFIKSQEHILVCRCCTFQDDNNDQNLLGFSQDGKDAIMGGGKAEFLLSLNILSKKS